MKDPSAFKRLLIRFAPIIKYAIFGIGTAVINFGIFFLGTEIVKDPNRTVLGLQWWQIVNLSAWIFANIYSFYVNRKFVFKTKHKQPILKEILAFFGIRLISFVVSTFIMYYGINTWDLNHQIAKILGAILEIFINYFTCKFFIFKSPKKHR